MKTTTDPIAGKGTAPRMRRWRANRSALRAGRIAIEELAFFETLSEQGVAGDLEGADLLVFICAGADEVGRVDARYSGRNPHASEVIAVVPRGIEPPAIAAQHYAITAGSEQALLHGVANILIASGWVERRSVAARAVEFSDFIAHFTTDRVSSVTGLSADDLWHFAQTIADGRRVAFRWPAAGAGPRERAATRSVQTADGAAQTLECAVQTSECRLADG